MNKSLKKISIIIITLILMLGSIYTTKSFATLPSDSGTDWGTAINPGDFDPSKDAEDMPSEIQSKVNTAFTIVQIVGVVVSTVGASVLGIKYLLGSVEKKAEYKKTMIPYIVGIIFIACTPTILRLIYNLTNQALN